MPQVAREPRHWTRLEYERLVNTGFFRPGEPIELIGGQLLVCEPVGEPHAVAVGIAADVLRAAFGPGWVVREEKPVALDDESEPEPDLAVVPGAHRDYLAGHPARPVLVVEVAESSLYFDRKQKAGLYARGGVTDYWIINLVDRTVEVYREPVPDSTAPFAWRYGSIEAFRPPASISPLEKPEALVNVADLLP